MISTHLSSAILIFLLKKNNCMSFRICYTIITIYPYDADCSAWRHNMALRHVTRRRRSLDAELTFNTTVTTHVKPVSAASTSSASCGLFGHSPVSADNVKLLAVHALVVSRVDYCNSVLQWRNYIYERRSEQLPQGAKRQGALGGAFGRRIVCFALQNSVEFLKRERS